MLSCWKRGEDHKHCWLFYPTNPLGQCIECLKTRSPRVATSPSNWGPIPDAKREKKSTLQQYRWEETVSIENWKCAALESGCRKRLETERRQIFEETSLKLRASLNERERLSQLHKYKCWVWQQTKKTFQKKTAMLVSKWGTRRIGMVLP